MTGRTFLIGRNGWVGTSLWPTLTDAIPLSSERILAERDLYLTALGLESGDVIVNAAGSRHPDPEVIEAVNVGVVRVLVDAAVESGARVVQLGSAAEYGLAGDSRPVSETAPKRPLSPYGRTKLEATRLVEDSGAGVALRIFNILAGPPQPGSPLDDILARTLAAATAQKPVEVMSAGTVRDWVSKSFVLTSIRWAVDHPCAGVFNVGSGRPVTVGQIAEALLEELGSGVGLRDLQSVPVTSIVADPGRWTVLTGLAESLTPSEIARLVLGRGQVLGFV